LRIFLTGATGQLGIALLEAFADADVEAPARAALDLTDEDRVAEAVRASAPDAVVNCAAYNDVDGAEEHPEEALATNAVAVRALARAADAAGATLVHFGTDFVFDGTADRPYTEEDKPRPRSSYGASKLAGERLARQAARHFVLRVESLFGGPLRKSTVDRMLAALARGEKVRAFADRVVSPTYVDDLARAVRFLLEGEASFGLYHAVSSGETTWLGLALLAQRLLGREGLVEAISVDEVQLRAVRPRYCALSNAKLAAAGFLMPAWQNALQRSILEVAG
jgi:dTDP-4-dehydrorhamnose reductase